MHQRLLADRVAKMVREEPEKQRCSLSKQQNAAQKRLLSYFKEELPWGWCQGRQHTPEYHFRSENSNPFREAWIMNGYLLVSGQSAYVSSTRSAGGEGRLPQRPCEEEL